MKKSRGIIAFMDILGYQSFLENNSATESALQVLEMITTLPKSTHAELSKSWIDHKFDKTIVEAMQHVIFSDTIVLLLPYGSEQKQDISSSVFYMTTCAGVLAARMFDAGLPMRGAVHEGEFIVKESCFAGKGIVEAYRLCSQLDFSGLVVSDTITARLADDHGAEIPIINKDHYRHLFVPILTPLKSGKTEVLDEDRLTHVNWFLYTAGALRAHLEADVIQCVMSRFWKHDKDCPRAVDGKIRNTCKILRRLRIAAPPPPPQIAQPKLEEHPKKPA